MIPGLAFPIPVDPATASWAIPVFALMALTTIVVLIWQTVRYFRDNRDDDQDARPGSDDAA
ncbi:hypothetical protein EV141_0748 [Microcella putealis]|uniref:Uncharacterized protein n=1 Tax=Microcella putealis TaxID=337005 RepID=A0A4Q7M0E4_9MICO|nr:hypothetical protein [Microcella putealis]RZS59519.1 hypothetical protein EV141_0748 [Microcella putealis]TQM26632.1 hypothetical protein BJ957_0044 [Microcella putealis]